jgi:hypothetical protein
MSYAQFRVCVSRLRRRRHRKLPEQCRNNRHSRRTQITGPDPSRSDPFRNLREQREKKQQSGFEYDPFSINKNFID